MSDLRKAESGPLTVLVTYGSKIDAELNAGVLRQAGIEVMIRADDGGGMYPTLASVRGVELLVRRQDVERAKEALSAAEPITGNELDDEAEAPES